MKPVSPRLRRAALIFVAALLALPALAWLLLPGLLQSRAVATVAASGHRLTLARPEINPFALSIRLRDLALEEPDGAPLLAFRELFVDLSGPALLTGTLAFDAIHLEGLQATLERRPQGLNWAPLIDALAGPPQPEPAAKAPPRLRIGHLDIRSAAIALADRQSATPVATRIDDLDLELRDITTREGGQGQFALHAHTAFGAAVEWNGDLSLAPIGSRGTLAVQGIDLDKLGALLGPRLPVRAPAGQVALRFAYQGGLTDGKPVLSLSQIELAAQQLAWQARPGAEAARLRLEAFSLRDGGADLATQQISLPVIEFKGLSVLPGSGSAERSGAPLRIPTIALRGLALDLAQRRVALETVTAAGGRLAVTRDAAGHLDLPALLATLAPPPANPPAAVEAKAAPWQTRVGRAALEDFGIALADAGSGIALDVTALSADAGPLGGDARAAIPLKLSAGLRSGGKLALQGRFTPATAAAELQAKIEDLSLVPLQPLVNRQAALDLAGGRIAAEGSVSHGTAGTRYRGSLFVNDLRLQPEGTREVFLGWKRFGTARLEATPRGADIAELRLDGLDGKLIIYSDKSNSLQRVLRKPSPANDTAATPATETAASATGPAAIPAGTPATAAVPAPAAATPAFALNIDRLRLREGQLTFGDYSLLLPFETRIHTLRGSINGLSTTPGGRAQLELDGEVDDYGLARAVGQLNLFNPTAYMDLKVVFRNVEMTRLTPYLATFAGRKIESGKLSLDLQYRIQQRQLQGENQMVIDRLELGERIASPTAKDLPLDLAIAILRDSDGRIDLGLPVAGNLDDPQFSYGAIVWKAITNVLTKIVTAPFRALGALFGGGAEKVEAVLFDAGAGRLTPPEREKLVRIAGVLEKRPGLALTVQGTWSEADRVALQERQTRRTVGQRAGLELGERGDPGPLSTGSPKVQAAIESVFADRFGSGELAVLKDGFRAANPGQLPESLGGRMISRLSGLMAEKRALSTKEAEELKGADFHGLLFNRLRSAEKVADEALQALATRRSEQAIEVLQKAGAPAGRYAAGAIERLAEAEREIPLKLQLDKAK